MNTQVDTATQATIECRFTLKRARDMVRTFSQINPSNKNVKQRLL